MPIDTATLATIGSTVAAQIKNEVIGGIQEAIGDLSAQDRAAIVAAVEGVSVLAARQFAGDTRPETAAELAQWKAVIVQYQDAAALIAKRVTRERLQAIADEVGIAALKAGEAILKGLITL